MKTSISAPLLPCLAVLLLSTELFGPSPTRAAEVAVGPGSGVTLEQLDFPGLPSPAVNTGIGMLSLDLDTLRLSSGMDSGYLNVSRGQHWLVRNLPIFPPATYPYASMAAEFNLGVSAGTNVPSLSLSMAMSDTPVATFAGGGPSTFAVGNRDIDYGSGELGPELGEAAGTMPPRPPDLTEILFGSGHNTNAEIQFDHPNIEAADDQCLPASIANSLQFLEDTTNLTIPHANTAGLKGDDSLVGQLDTAIDRAATDRRHGSGVNQEDGLYGKMTYLLDNNLQDKVRTTHWSAGLGDQTLSWQEGGKDRIRAEGQGKLVSITEIMDCLKRGGDVEVGYIWPGGGHAVEVIGAGITDGKPWIIHASDLDQADDSKGAGASGHVFEYLDDNDNDGEYNLSGSNREVYRMFCQEYIGDPVTTTTGLTTTHTEDPAGHSCCVTPPPAVMTVTVTGSGITFSDSGISWLPMAGTILADGTFSANSTGTVAGFPNVQSTFTGTLTNGRVTGGTITVGVNGELFGVPIAYTVDLAPAGQTVTVTQDTTIAPGDTMTINAGDTLVVSAGVTLTVNGTLKNAGTLTVQGGGIIDNNGIVDNHGTLDNHGTVTNQAGGTLANDGTLTNSDPAARITNQGTMSNDAGGSVSNAGIIANQGGTTNNAGAIANAGTITNTSGSTINNLAGGTLTNSSPTTVDNSGTINNGAAAAITNEPGAAFTVQAGGLLRNQGSLTNNGTLNNAGSIHTTGTFGGSGSVNNTATLTIGCGGSMTATLSGNSSKHACWSANPGQMPDFDLSGTADLFWRHGLSGQTRVWLMDGTAVAASGSPARVGNLNQEVAAYGDFDGDCSSDLLWRDSTTGRLTFWLMNGTTKFFARSPWTYSSLNWRIAGSGDFNGDGKTDLLWRHAASGQTSIWLMDGTTKTSASGGQGTVRANDWQILDLGDFNGDGQTDLLWRQVATGRTSVWLMDGITPVTSASPGVRDPNWEFVDLGDFNGDGKMDVLWRHATIGTLLTWLMDGTALTTSRSPGGRANDWKINGLGDFNGDGKSDLFWRRTTTGQTSVWLMDGTTQTASGSPGTIKDSGWKFIDLGDFNGDGNTDVFWRHATTGRNSIWLMNGTTKTAAGNPGTLGDVNWQVQ